MRSASALRFSKGCSSLNLDRMVEVLDVDTFSAVVGCGVGFSLMTIGGGKTLLVRCSDGESCEIKRQTIDAFTLGRLTYDDGNKLSVRMEVDEQTEPMGNVGVSRMKLLASELPPDHVAGEGLRLREGLIGDGKARAGMSGCRF